MEVNVDVEKIITIRVAIHGTEVGLTVDEAESLRDDLDTALDEARDV